MREQLRLLRLSNFLSQEKMSERCKTSRNNYAMIEKGQRAGSADFWLNLQEEFNLPLDKLKEMRKVSEVKQ